MKKIVENFLIKKFNELFKNALMEQTREFYLPLNQRLKTDDGSPIDYSILEEMKKDREEHFERKFNTENFEELFSIVERLFFELCRPDDLLFSEFLDCVPTQTKYAFRNIVIREQIGLQALVNYEYFFICKVYNENKNKIMDSVKANGRAHMRTMTKELTTEYEAKITSYLQIRATRLLTAKYSSSTTSGLPAGKLEQLGKPARDPIPHHKGVEKIVAFGQAHSRLRSPRLTFKEFRLLQKTVNEVIHNPALRESAVKLYGKTTVDEATLLAQEYTMFRD